MTALTRCSGAFFVRVAGAVLAAGVACAVLTVSSTPARAVQAGDSPVGTWQTVDDATGQPKALVQITEDGTGALSGKVVKGLNPRVPSDKRCTACTDARKNQPIIGMTIINDMKKDGDQWSGGQILDPENGKIYHCQMHLEDGGQKLVVRGYVGAPLFGRSQTWNRQP